MVVAVVLMLMVLPVVLVAVVVKKTRPAERNNQGGQAILHHILHHKEIPEDMVSATHHLLTTLEAVVDLADLVVMPQDLPLDLVVQVLQST